MGHFAYEPMAAQDPPYAPTVARDPLEDAWYGMAAFSFAEYRRRYRQLMRKRAGRKGHGQRHNERMAQQAVHPARQGLTAVNLGSAPEGRA